MRVYITPLYARFQQDTRIREITAKGSGKAEDRPADRSSSREAERTAAGEPKVWSKASKVAGPIPCTCHSASQSDSLSIIESGAGQVAEMTSEGGI